jgi:pimeloyl-ACP methyl ester carboxylesterase
MRALALLLFAVMSAGAANQAAPLLVFLPGGPGHWQPQVGLRGWALAVVDSAPTGDAGVKALESAIGEAKKRQSVDPRRVYLAGQGDGAALVFYAISRRPDLWAAAAAIGGDPTPAIETNRLFSANAQLVPLLWITTLHEREALAPIRARLAEAGFPVESGTAAEFGYEQLFDWFADHTREEFPEKVDCETGSPEFARCYWAEITKFDPARRNDVLEPTRVPPGSGARFADNGFVIAAGPGPGALVQSIAPNFKGPFKAGDRIVAIAGKEISDARQYAQFMSGWTEARTVGVLVERGKERVRFEAPIVIPPREERTTARVQVQFLPDTRELLVITRGVAELIVNLPGYWTPCPINWNGDDLGTATEAGSWILAPGAKARRAGPQVAPEN